MKNRKMAEITINEFCECLDGFNITDCVIRDVNSFCFVAREAYTNWPKSKWNSDTSPPPDEEDLMKHYIIFSRNRNSGDRLARAQLLDLDDAIIGQTQKPEIKAVIVTLDGNVFSTGGGSNEFEARMARWEDGGPSRGGVHKLRTIDGWLYFCGGANSVGKRTDNGRWMAHTHNIPNRSSSDPRPNMLHDIDGFSESDLYVVGSRGQAMHFDGKSWKNLPVPTNINLYTVCCAGDGQVYISGNKGTTYKGRGATWKLVHTGELRLPFRDMVWHSDRIWCTSDYGVWTIFEDNFSAIELSNGLDAYAGNLSVFNETLLLAGYGGAAFLENGMWTKIFNMTEMSLNARGNKSS